jgi:hypothetical protein
LVVLTFRKPVPRSGKKPFVSNFDYFGEKGRDGIRVKDFSLSEGGRPWIPVDAGQPEFEKSSEGRRDRPK